MAEHLECTINALTLKVSKYCHQNRTNSTIDPDARYCQHGPSRAPAVTPWPWNLR